MGKRHYKDVVDTDIGIVFEGEYKIWVDEDERIASFHEVEGYTYRMFADHENFIEFIFSMAANSFRFQ